MAATNFFIDTSKQHGSKLKSALNQLETGFDSLNDILANIPHMIDGDGSSSTHFVEVTNRYGFPDDATSKAAYEEIQSVMSKLNTDASVTSVNAALLQAFAKFF